ncbi:MAG: glycosyltransferase [Flavobacteriaceae bacterium]|nr:glycosyltransferase [Flavobacteriaceae bacterium]
MNVKVSVIIPMYNAAAHLEQCVASLLAQTLVHCDYIFVNDGSKDESQSIIEHYQKIDPRILLINQENQGVSVARNTGLKYAKGDYIGFVDADDFIANDYFEQLYQTAVALDLDVVSCNYYFTNSGRRYASKAPFAEGVVFEKEFIEENIVAQLIGDDNLNSIWNKLYKSSLIVGNAISFPQGVALGEDGLFNLDCFSKAHRVFFTSYVGYHYQEVQGSATRALQTKNYFKRIEEDYQQDYTLFGNKYLDAEKIAFLKAKKFIKKIIALLHFYYDPVTNLAQLQKRQLRNEVVYHQTTKKILERYYNVLFLQKSKYEQIILFALKYKSTFIIDWVIAYSNFRNKK